MSVHVTIDVRADTHLTVGPVHPTLPENRIKFDHDALLWLTREGGERLIAALREAVDALPVEAATP